MTRLLQEYRSRIVPELQASLGMTNIHAVPRLQKIVVSMGVGEAVNDRKRLDQAADQLTQLAGQKAQITRAKKSVAGFRLREGQPIGCRVTLRNKRMYDFLDRLITLALPRVRDFRGVTWVVEEAFAPLVGLHPAVDTVIPVATRRWRKQFLKRETWKEIAAFRRLLRPADRKSVV